MNIIVQVKNRRNYTVIVVMLCFAISNWNRHLRARKTIFIVAISTATATAIFFVLATRTSIEPRPIRHFYMGQGGHIKMADGCAFENILQLCEQAIIKWLSTTNKKLE